FPVGIGSLNCTFESGFCNWKKPIGATDNWRRRKGPSPSHLALPSVDHTYQNVSGYYLYARTSVKSEGSRLIVESPVFYSDSAFCLSFWYNGNGRPIGPFIVYDYFNVIYNISGNSESVWYPVKLDISSGFNKIKFVGVKGKYSNGDIALDDIAAVPGRC
ncbi:MAM and LDL-receptor class A domain-containing protein 1, partial [Trichoplax sp. H2]